VIAPPAADDGPDVIKTSSVPEQSKRTGSGEK